MSAERPAASLREQLDKPKRLTDFERIRAALVRGEDNDRLLDGRDFDHRYWINAKAALGRIERKTQIAERERDALRAANQDDDGWPKRWSDPTYLGDGPWGA